MDKSFISSFILPDKWEIVGYQLRPYSIQKHINLCAIDSPYLTGQVPTAIDTVKFLKYCSSDCKSIIDLEPRTFFDKIAHLRMVMSPAFHGHVVLSILNYLKQYSVGPKYRVANKKVTETIVSKNTLPEMLFLAGVCMSKLHMREEDVMSAPLSKLSWYAVLIAALEGEDVRIEDDDKDKAVSDKDLILMHEAQEAEKLRLSMVNGKIPVRKIKIRNQ